MTRTELYREFNYSERICKVFDLEQTRKQLLERLQEVDNELQESKAVLPENIIKEYEAVRIMDKLKGEL